jgi:hypothetical protein
VQITTYNQHVRLLSRQPWLVTNNPSLPAPEEPTPLWNQNARQRKMWKLQGGFEPV